jgi:hypothetical protein
LIEEKPIFYMLIIKKESSVAAAVAFYYYKNKNEMRLKYSVLKQQILSLKKKNSMNQKRNNLFNPQIIILRLLLIGY